MRGWVDIAWPCSYSRVMSFSLFRSLVDITNVLLLVEHDSVLVQHEMLVMV
jgi:hypothetical protein